VQLLDGPAATCNSASCHGGDNAAIGNLNYWPGAASGTVYPDRPGEHNVHIQKLAAKLGYPFNSSLTDAQQKDMCTYCHTSAGEGPHGRGARGCSLLQADLERLGGRGHGGILHGGQRHQRHVRGGGLPQREVHDDGLRLVRQRGERLHHVPHGGGRGCEPDDGSATT